MRKYILLFLPMLLLWSFAFRTAHMVRGTVTGANGVPLSGASVVVKGTQNATTTDSKGQYSLSLADTNAHLVFTFVGYSSKEERVGSRTEINVQLTGSAHALSEVVIVGTGYDLNRTLSGRASGVQLGAPGASSIRVRGISNQGRGNKGHLPASVPYNREGYDPITDNPFRRAADHPLSTFSIDVDAASYSNVRRFLNEGVLPPYGAVRVEELINYFTYDYPQPSGGDPVSITTEVSDCPWNPEHRLVLVGLQAKKIATEDLPPSNLVFLIDVSGSMNDPQKLPLVQASLRLLTDQLRPEDKVAIVVYAGSAGLVLPTTGGTDKISIREAISQLEGGGSTAGGAGIQLAYKQARESFLPGGNNRVILCTDGDFNVGVSSNDELVRMIEKERETGIFLTVLGYGSGNYQDSKMQQLADKGNGNHAYIDRLQEARKVLVQEFGGTLFTIAKDVKLQVEFNPSKVNGYRLIGYENRMLENEDFNDDKKDAGELGSGHTVTALYEVIPAGVESAFLRTTDSLRYGQAKTASAAGEGAELGYIKLRYKEPGESKSRLLQQAVADRKTPILQASDNLRFAASVAGFGMLLRNSPYRSEAGFAPIRMLAEKATGRDAEGYRKEFLKLLQLASDLKEKEKGLSRSHQ